jgi:hypothetical protein
VEAEGLSAASAVAHADVTRDLLGHQLALQIAEVFGIRRRSLWRTRTHAASSMERFRFFPRTADGGTIRSSLPASNPLIDQRL